VGAAENVTYATCPHDLLSSILIKQRLSFYGNWTFVLWALLHAGGDLAFIRFDPLLASLRGDPALRAWQIKLCPPDRADRG
jgi:hypothetical protein